MSSTVPGPELPDRLWGGVHWRTSGGVQHRQWPQVQSGQGGGYEDVEEEDCDDERPVCDTIETEQYTKYEEEC